MRTVMRSVGAGVAAVAVVLGLTTIVPAAHATVTLDQDFTTASAPSTIAVPANTIYLRAQVFTAGLSGPLTQVTFPWIKYRNTSGNLTVTIRAAVSNTPTTTVLATQVIPNSDLPAALAPFDVEFDTPATVTAGTSYAIVLAASADAVDVGYSNTGGYPDGRETYSTDGSTGATWTGGTTRDLYFQTYVDAVTTPAAPTGLAVAGGDGQLDVTCTLGSNGGSAVTDVEYELDSGGWVSTGVTACSFSITGLANGTTYSVRVRAINGVGNGAASAAASGTTVTPIPPKPRPAGPPLDVEASASDGAAAVLWAAPASSGSFAISNYLVTAAPGGRMCLTSSLSCTVSGLTNGTAYTFTVKALTGAGWSPSSAPSASVTPQAPVRPSIVISGVREGPRIEISGMVTGMGMGAVLTPWVQRVGDKEFAAGKRRILVSEDGTFTWGRRARTAVEVRVESPDGSIRSNTVSIKGRSSAR